MLKTNPYPLGLQPIDFENYTSPKNYVKKLRIHKYPSADEVMLDLKKAYYKSQNKTSVTAEMKELLMYVTEKLFEGHDPSSFVPREKPKKEVAAIRVKEDFKPKTVRRSGKEWFDVYKRSKDNFEASPYKTVYKTLANFCNFATDKEVDQVELQRI